MLHYRLGNEAQFSTRRETGADVPVLGGGDWERLIKTADGQRL